MWQEHSDLERFADWPQRLSQREIGQVEGIIEGEPWLHFGDQLFIEQYSRGVDKQQALARSNSRTNLQRRFGVAFRTDWYGSIVNQFFQLLRIGTKMVGPGASEMVLGLATVALVDGASVFIFSVTFQEVGTFHLAFDTDAFTLSPTGGVASLLPRTRKNRPRTSCFLTSLPRVLFPATLRSTLMKESWRPPTRARWSESRRRGGAHSFWTK